jgi:hypothetical protein
MRCERHGNGTGSGLVILLSAILVLVAFKVRQSAFQVCRKIALLGGDVQRFAAGFTTEPTVQVCWARRNGTSDPHDRHTAFCPALSYVNWLAQEGRNLLPPFQRRWRGFGIRRFLLRRHQLQSFVHKAECKRSSSPDRVRPAFPLEQFFASCPLRIFTVPDLQPRCTSVEKVGIIFPLGNNSPNPAIVELYSAI